jgi:plastocyanin
MRAFRPAGVFVVTALSVACSDHASRGPSTLTGPDPVAGSAAVSGEGAVSGATSARLSATMKFGLPGVGTDFPPDLEHDQSVHADDTLVPSTVVIDAGGTVTFNAVGIHQIAIYEPGKEPEDVGTSPTVAMGPGCPPTLPAFRINDPVDRIAINGANPVGCGNRTYTHTFDEPGKYLVICEVLPHFNIKMYGWVVVRDR